MNALVFPGQGSQKVGMGKAIVDAFPWAAKIAAETDQILNRQLTSICFEGPEEVLKDTENTQPALFFVSALLTEAIKREGFPFHAVAGHSLGEYSALYAAEVAPYEDLLKLVAKRAKAMKNACPPGKGTMAAIMMLDKSILSEICTEISKDDVCVLANINCPGQIVISGTVTGVERAMKMALERKAKRAVLLEVSGPFHSPLMQPAKEELAEAIANIKFSNAKVPVFTNVDGIPTTSGEELKQKLLMQLTGSVKWEDCIKSAWNFGIRRFIELGPGKVLCGLIKKIVPEANTDQAQDPESIATILATNQAY